MAKRSYSSRGPKCPDCGAVMSPKDEGGEPICWHAKSHAGILRARAKAATQQGDSQRKKKT